ncbi:Methyltransferase domain-containing protein [Faunimonas pinastri]|uniref:Methyltransferase domain-containing protein n=1 Tax=Faunimonas pinastri TaxID=1855383 RepID=A0A1H9KBQ1_9HYPH|nr:rhodoquinone biosynthesis methyltransferase RquA [Faunimonas pinastri]SEQ96357.1 Methyltransferase domain-containing protein [Faunimonas pinastri]
MTDLATALSVSDASSRTVPEYLKNTYRWAYLDARTAPILDRHLVVQAILWGNADRLMDRAIAEFSPGDHVLQPAAVYGNFSQRLAAHLGPEGRLQVSDIAPLQVALTRRKLAAYPNAKVVRANAASPASGTYDGVCCFFLLHEVPGPFKRQIVNSVLASLQPGGKAVFVDYHRPGRFHPLRPIMKAVFHLLEPFAEELCASEIRKYADGAEGFAWSKETAFGGLYQIVIARKPAEPR